MIPRHYGDEVDLARLPEDDTEVYRRCARADTVGMFQVESRAQMASHSAQCSRQKFYDLVVQVAIIRPGPIVGKMMHPYMRRRQGKEEVTYPVAGAGAGAEADAGCAVVPGAVAADGDDRGELYGGGGGRAAQGGGDAAIVEADEGLMVKLRTGMRTNGIAPETQEVIVRSIQSFALYGFPESHAASFALMAYASAYFKVKYLAAFTCAMLNNQPMGFYTPAVLVKDAQRHGLRVRPVDVQRSRCGVHG